MVGEQDRRTVGAVSGHNHSFSCGASAVYSTEHRVSRRELERSFLSEVLARYARPPGVGQAGFGVIYRARLQGFPGGLSRGLMKRATDLGMEAALARPVPKNRIWSRRKVG